MPAPQAFAFPLLLAALYGVYRVGRGRDGAFERTRLVALALLLGLLALVEMRLALAGRMDSPGPLVAGVLAVSAATGLVGLHVLRVVEASRAADGVGSAPSMP